MARAAAPGPRLVSVVIPTYHRPERLPATVRSVLEQELPAGWELEVVVAVSDPGAAADRAAAAALAADPRVKVAEAGRPGPAAARNAGMRAAAGRYFAFIDDDCLAAPGWLAAGMRALENADLVQGATRPEGAVPQDHHTLWVTPPSWLWESCNLMVRREAVERLGGFDESWNPTGRVGGHMGEDCEWGWRLVHGGARPAFVPEALVHHDVVPRDFRGYLRYQAGLRHFPLLFRAAPEVRQVFYRGYFVRRRHVALTAVAGLSLVAAGAGLAGRRRLAAGAVALAAGAYLWPLRRDVARLRGRALWGDLQRRVPLELVEFGSAVYGSARWRRLLL